MRVIQVPPSPHGTRYVTGLAADAKGHVYLCRGGEILVYGTASGDLQRTITAKTAHLDFTDVAVDANGTLYAVHASASDDAVVSFNAAGGVAHRWDHPVSATSSYDALTLNLGVDGLGQMFFASHSGNQVYRLDSAGRLVDRFGSEGDQPGQLDAPAAIAVDGQGRVLVQEFLGRVDVFDGTGRFLSRLDPQYTKGAPMGMTLDRQGNLYQVTNEGKVLKYRLTGLPTP